jgi:serine/threonine protein kinase
MQNGLFPKYINFHKPVGAGSFGVVFSGTMPDNSTVAIKVFSPNFQSFSGVTEEKVISSQRDNFTRECNRQIDIRHENLVRAIQMINIENKPVLIMEYVPNLLAKQLKKLDGSPRTIPLVEALDITLQLCEAIDYLFFGSSQSLSAHLDIRDMNILITNDGIIKLGDLGLASKINNFNASSTYSFPIVAPEQLSGQISAATDVWAIGLLLYRMLSGKIPYIGNVPLNGFQFGKVLSQNPNLVVSQLEQMECSTDVKELLGLLVTSSDKRIPSVRQLRTYIENFKNQNETTIGQALAKLPTRQESLLFLQRVKEAMGKVIAATQSNQLELAIKLCSDEISNLQKAIDFRRVGNDNCHFSPYFYWLGWFLNQIGSIYLRINSHDKAIQSFLMARTILVDVYNSNRFNQGCVIELIFACQQLILRNEVSIEQRWTYSKDMLFVARNEMFNNPSLENIKRFRTSFSLYTQVMDIIKKNQPTKIVDYDKQYVETCKKDFRETSQWIASAFQYQNTSTTPVQIGNGIYKYTGNITVLDPDGQSVDDFEGKVGFFILDTDTGSLADGATIEPRQFKFAPENKGVCQAHVTLDNRKLKGAKTKVIGQQNFDLDIQMTIIKKENKDGIVSIQAWLAVVNAKNQVWMYDFTGSISFSASFKENGQIANNVQIEPRQHIFRTTDIGKVKVNMSYPESLDNKIIVKPSFS